MILETAKQFVEQTGTNKNQAPYYQAILFIYIVLLISYEERYIYHRYCGVNMPKSWEGCL